MKHVIIGNIDGGAAVAARLRRLDEFAEIICLEDLSASEKKEAVEIDRKNKLVKVKLIKRQIIYMEFIPRIKGILGLAVSKHLTIMVLLQS